MSVIVDMPFKKLLPRTDAGEMEAAGDATQATVRLCEYVRAIGERCHQPAVQDGRLCERHLRWLQSLPTYMVLPYPEDGVALQEIAGRAVAMAMARVIDGRATLAIAALCRIMQKNLPEVMRELERAD